VYNGGTYVTEVDWCRLEDVVERTAAVHLELVSSATAASSTYRYRGVLVTDVAHMSSIGYSVWNAVEDLSSTASSFASSGTISHSKMVATSVSTAKGEATGDGYYKLVSTATAAATALAAPAVSCIDRLYGRSGVYGGVSLAVANAAVARDSLSTGSYSVMSDMAHMSDNTAVHSRTTSDFADVLGLSVHAIGVASSRATVLDTLRMQSAYGVGSLVLRDAQSTATANSECVSNMYAELLSKALASTTTQTNTSTTPTTTSRASAYTTMRITIPVQVQSSMMHTDTVGCRAHVPTLHIDTCDITDTSATSARSHITVGDSWRVTAQVHSMSSVVLSDSATASTGLYMSSALTVNDVGHMQGVGTLKATSFATGYSQASALDMAKGVETVVVNSSCYVTERVALGVST